MNYETEQMQNKKDKTNRKHKTKRKPGGSNTHRNFEVHGYCFCNISIISLVNQNTFKR